VSPQQARGEIAALAFLTIRDDPAVGWQFVQPVARFVERNVLRIFSFPSSAISSTRRALAAAEAPPATPPTMMMRWGWIEVFI